MYIQFFSLSVVVLSLTLGCNHVDQVARVRVLESGSVTEIQEHFSTLNEVQSRLQVGSSSELYSTPLHVAVTGGRISVVQHLLKVGANPNAVDYLGKTALFEFPRDLDKATATQLLQLLVDAGADLNHSEPTSGQTALMEASSNGAIIFVELLVKNGAKLNLHNNVGQTAYDQIGEVRTIDPSERTFLEGILRGE